MDFGDTCAPTVRFTLTLTVRSDIPQCVPQQNAYPSQQNARAAHSRASGAVLVVESGRTEFGVRPHAAGLQGRGAGGDEPLLGALQLGQALRGLGRGE